MKNFDAAKHPRKKHQGAVGKGDNGGHFATTERNEIFVDNTSDHIAPVNALGEPLPAELAIDADTRQRLLFSTNSQERQLALAYPDCDTRDIKKILEGSNQYARRDALSHPAAPVEHAIKSYMSGSKFLMVAAASHPEFPENLLRERALETAESSSAHNSDVVQIMKNRGIDTAGLEWKPQGPIVEAHEKTKRIVLNPESTDAELRKNMDENIQSAHGEYPENRIASLAWHTNASRETALCAWKTLNENRAFTANSLAQHPRLTWNDAQEIIRASYNPRNAEFTALKRSDVPRSFIDEKLADESVYMQAAAAASPSATDADWQKIVSRATVKDVRVACLQQSRTTADEIRKLTKTQSHEVIFYAIRHPNTPSDVLEKYIGHDSLSDGSLRNLMSHPNMPAATLKKHALSADESPTKFAATEALLERTVRHFQKR